MPDCPNSPDGYHEWKPGPLPRLAVWCPQCNEEMSIRTLLSMLNAAERLRAKSAETVAELIPDSIFSNELRAYAARRKDGE